MAWTNGLTLIIKIILSILLIASFAVYLRKFWSYNAYKRIDSLILNAEDQWQVKKRDGTVYPAVLGDSLFVHPCLTIFSLKFSQYQEYFIFTPEILDADTFRRLRVRLRFRVSE